MQAHLVKALVVANAINGNILMLFFCMLNDLRTRDMQAMLVKSQPLAWWSDFLATDNNRAA